MTHRSTLGRLFTYSKDTLVVAQENFTTEALAAAISRDGAPMVRALGDLARRNRTFDRACPEARSLSVDAIEAVETQTFLPEVGAVAGESGYGFLDLVLRLRGGRQVWIEVKVGSPLREDQLEAYRDAARRRPDPPPAVISLTSREAVREAKVEGVAALDWNDLYASVRRRGVVTDRWADLLEFLEEQGVASERTMEITDQEAGSVRVAFRLFEKVGCVHEGAQRDVDPVAERRGYLSLGGGRTDAATKAPYNVEQTGAMLNFLANTFRSDGTMLTRGGPVRYGIVELDGSAFWIVAVERGGWKQDKVERVIGLARGLLGSDRSPADRWEEDANGPLVLQKSVRVSRVQGGGAGPDGATAWIRRAVEELDGAQLFEEFWPPKGSQPADQS